MSIRAGQSGGVRYLAVAMSTARPGYSYFGWLLDDYNKLNDKAVALIGLGIGGVPKPATWAMMLPGMAGLYGLIRKKSKRASR